MSQISQNDMSARGSPREAPIGVIQQKKNRSNTCLIVTNLFLSVIIIYLLLLGSSSKSPVEPPKEQPQALCREPSKEEPKQEAPKPTPKEEPNPQKEPEKPAPKPEQKEPEKPAPKPEQKEPEKPRPTTDAQPAKYAHKWNEFYNFKEVGPSASSGQVVKDLNKDMGSQKSFEQIYEKKFWDGTAKHPSGAGSVPQTNIDYLLLVQQLIDHPKINKIVELGFGDFQLSGRLRIPASKTYHGFDVAKVLLRPNETNKFFSIITGIHDFNETGDLLLIKQVMQHWPNAEIKWFLDNIVPRFKYALLTNDPTTRPRGDIRYGRYSPVNMNDYHPKKEMLGPGCYIIPDEP